MKKDSPMTPTPAPMTAEEIAALCNEAMAFGEYAHKKLATACAQITRERDEARASVAVLVVWARKVADTLPYVHDELDMSGAFLRAQSVKDLWTEYKTLYLPAASQALLARMEGMRTALKECADDLESLVENQYSDTKHTYPSEKRRYERDIEPVRKARAALNEGEAT
jgi:hypothetical protein